jgi:hypothetical protein
MNSPSLPIPSPNILYDPDLPFESPPPDTHRFLSGKLELRPRRLVRPSFRFARRLVWPSPIALG